MSRYRPTGGNQPPAEPPPRPAAEPLNAQRRASNTGVIMIAGQKIALGRIHAGHAVTGHVAEHAIIIELGGDDIRTVRRTTTQAVAASRPTVPASLGPPIFPRAPVKHVLGQPRQASRGSRHNTFPEIARRRPCLREHRKRQAEDRLVAGALWQDHGLVFASAIGTPLDAANVRREFRKITEAVGLGTEWAPRDLRHTLSP